VAFANPLVAGSSPAGPTTRLCSSGRFGVRLQRAFTALADAYVGGSSSVSCLNLQSAFPGNHEKRARYEESTDEDPKRAQIYVALPRAAAFATLDRGWRRARLSVCALFASSVQP
jgi:hypothetical protein